MKYKVALAIFLSIIVLTSIPIPINGNATGTKMKNSLEYLTAVNGTITISGNNGFSTDQYVTSGNGSVQNPYVISNLSLSVNNQTAISISNTNVHFILENIRINLLDIVQGNEGGIYLYNVSNGEIINITIFSEHYPLTYRLNGTYLANETMDGINMFDSSDDIIENSAFSNLTAAIGFYYSSGLKIYNNYINNAVINGVGAEYSSDSLIEGNKVYNNHHNNMQLINSNNLTVSGNVLVNAGGDNIWFWNTNNSIAVNNTATGCPYQSMLVDPGNNDNVSGNTIYKVNQGVVVIGNNTTVSYNRIFDTNQSIIISGEYPSNVSYNRIYNSTSGILISCGAYVSYNNINGTTKAILLQFGHSDTVTSNMLYSNEYGIFIQDDSSATIYNNYFSNVINAYSDSHDIWNITPYAGRNIIGGDIIAGNYWSDYFGTGQNGIGSTGIPFNDGGNIEYGGDYAPLITDSRPYFTVENFSGSYDANVTIPVNIVDGNSFINISQTFSYNPELLQFLGVYDDVSSTYVSFTFVYPNSSVVTVNGKGVFSIGSNNTTLYTLVFRPLLKQQMITDVVLDSTLMNGIYYAPYSRSFITLSSGWQFMGPRNVTFQFGETPVFNGSGEVTSFGYSPYYPSIMYAGSGIKIQLGMGGIYRSLDGGKEWQQVNSGLKYLSVESIAVNEFDPYEVVIITQGFIQAGNPSPMGAIYKTTNGGTTWQETYDEGGLSLEYTNGSLYAATFNSILVSNDFGSTWRILATQGANIPQGQIQGMLVLNGGKDIYAAISGGSTYNGQSSAFIVLSQDYGTNFRTISQIPDHYGSAYMELVSNPKNSSIMWLIIMMGYSYDSLFRSNDSGILWNQVNLTSIGLSSVFTPGIGYAPQFIAYDPNNASVMFLGGDGYFFESTDGGEQFRHLIPGPNLDIRFIYFDPFHNNTVFVGSDQGLYISHNLGESWTGFNNRTTSLLSEVSISGSNIITNVADFSSIDSNNFGRTWYENSANLTGEGGVSATDPYNSSIMLFLAFVFKVSQDGGKTFFTPGGNWSGIKQQTPFSNIAFKNGRTESLFAFFKNYPQIIMVGGYDGIYESKNYGSSFYRLNNSPSDTLSIAVSENDTIYASNFTGLYASYDMGLSWKLINENFPGYEALSSLFCDPLDPYIIAGVENFDGLSTLFISNDGGHSFYYGNISTGYIYAAPGAVMFINSSNQIATVFMGGSGIYVSYDMGKQWYDRSFNLDSEPSVTSLSLINGTAYISTWGEGVLSNNNLFNDTYYNSTPVLTIYSSTNSTVKVNGITLSAMGFTSIELSIGNNSVEVITNGTVFYYNLSARSSMVYFLNLSVSKTLVTLLQTGIPASTDWSIISGNQTLTFSGQAGSIYLSPGLHNITILPSYSDYSLYYPIQQNITIKVGYYPVNLNINYSSQNDYEQRNITGNITGIMWIASSASNGKYILLVGQGLGLVDTENMKYYDLSSLNIPGFFRSVTPYKEGFIIGGSDDGNIALLFYVNVSSMKASNYTYLLPRNIQSGAVITQVSVDVNGSIVILGVNTGGMFLGFIYNNKYFSLMNYIPQIMNTSLPSSLSMTLMGRNNLILFVNGDVTELNLSTDFSTEISGNINAATGSINFYPTSYNYLSSENDTFILALNPSSGYQGIYEYVNGSFNDISNLFPASSMFFSSSWNGHDFLLSGEEGGLPLLSIYNPVSREVDNFVTDNSNINLITAASNSPFTFIVSGFQGLFKPQFFMINAIPTASVEIASDSPGFSIALSGMSIYSPDKNITVPLLSGNTTILVWKGDIIKNYSLHLSPFESSIIYPKFLPTVRYYNVMINESGLPKGTLWSLNFNGTNYSSTNNSILLEEKNGTYDYYINSADGYTPSPAHGEINVDGKNVVVLIAFEPKLSYFSIIFTESGLPSGTFWSITLNNMTKSSTNTTIIYNEPNGSYSYSARAIAGYRTANYSGFLTVSGNSIKENITWSVILYPMTIKENGIPNGTQWSVTLTGTAFNGQYINVTLSSTNNTITFNEPNGTYSYTIAISNNEYAPKEYSGSFVINGASITESITFNMVTYKITFTESGLSSGNTWYVTLNGTTKSSSNNTIIFNEPNGSYAYSIQGISGYRTTSYSGTIIVNGNSINENITWSVILYPMTIKENGIPNGTQWSVTLTGTAFNGQYINVTLSSTNNTIIFNEPNGTYSYALHLPSGYTTTNQKGSITVSGQSLALSMNAKHSSRPTSQSSNYSIIIIAVLLAAAIVALLAVLRKRK